MKAPVATVEPNGHNAASLRPTELPAAPSGADCSAPAPGGRFTYPSGSQPLPGFTIKRGVGHGGFGEVYYAVSDGGKEVALKLIRRNLDVELRGIRHCLNLKHPNLLDIYDIRQDAHGDNWVVMEFVTGECLENAVMAHPAGMPADRALAWLFGIGAGVACLHDHGIVHRDLKPANIFCDEGIVKLGDYGLSKFISCSRRSGQTESVGTVHYMAPEIANGRYGKEIDVYALGVILYEMLSGRVPFEGESVGEVLMKHLTTPPDVSMLADPYRSVVAKALEKDPAKRFGSVSEMLAALPRPSPSQVHVGPLPSAAGAAQTAAAAAAAIPVAQAVDEEPILRAVRQAFRKAHDAWSESGLNTPTKIILVMIGLFVLVKTAPGWVPVVFTLLIAYGLYWVARSIVLGTGSPRRPHAAGPPGSPFFAARPATPPPPPPAMAARQAAPPQPPRVARGWRPRREIAVDALVLKPPRERVAELVGSLLGSALVSIVLTVVMMILLGLQGPGPRPEQGAWLLLVSLAGSWAVLLPSKLWEGRDGDPWLRRFTLMVIGLGVGAFAYFVMAALGVALPPLIDSPGPHYRPPAGLYTAEGTPSLKACMAVFGTLFLAVRWWRLANPLRSTRMGVWSVIGCVFLAWLVGLLWQFDMPWLMIVAGMMAMAVQLSSPWVHPRIRRARAANR